jgi:hypothetical protein
MVFLHRVPQYWKRWLNFYFIFLWFSRPIHKPFMYLLKHVETIRIALILSLHVEDYFLYFWYAMVYYGLFLQTSQFNGVNLHNKPLFSEMIYNRGFYSRIRLRWFVNVTKYSITFQQ